MSGQVPGDRPDGARDPGRPSSRDRQDRPSGAARPAPPPGGAAAGDDATDDVSTLDDPMDDLDPRLAAMFTRAFRQPVEVEVAARHLWAIDREATRLAQERARPRGLRRVLVAAMAAVALLGTSTAAVAASGPAMPGDLLYPVKRGTEQARLLVARSPEAEALVLLDIASRRATEAEHAAEDNPEDVDRLLREAAVAFTAASAVAVESADVSAQAEEVRQSVADVGQTLGAQISADGRSEVDDAVAAPPAPARPAAPADPAPAAPPAPPMSTPPRPPSPPRGPPVVPPPIPLETPVPGLVPSESENAVPEVPTLPETGTAAGSATPSPSPTPSPDAVPPLPDTATPAIPGAAETGRVPAAADEVAPPPLPDARPAVGPTPPDRGTQVAPPDPAAQVAPTQPAAPVPPRLSERYTPMQG